MFVPLRGTPTWHFHTEFYKFQSNVSNNSTMKWRTELRLGEVVHLLIYCGTTNSWLLSLTGFNFNILWHDCENQELLHSAFSLIKQFLPRFKRLNTIHDLESTHISFDLFGIQFQLHDDIYLSCEDQF